MASQLDIKKAKAELLRVQANIAEMEVRIEDHMENIARLEASKATSVAKIEELTKTVSDLESGK
jgi:chromosome segregation ATPase